MISPRPYPTGPTLVAKPRPLPLWLRLIGAPIGAVYGAWLIPTRPAGYRPSASARRDALRVLDGGKP